MLVSGVLAMAVMRPVAGWSDGNGDRSEVMTEAVQEEVLSPDLIPVISQEDVSMAVVVVREVAWTRGVEGELELDAGPVTFEVVSRLHGMLGEGERIQVRAKRIVELTARVRHNFDAWNTLSLKPGEFVLLAVRRGATGREWNGVAGRAISSPAAPEVEAVRRAYAIEGARGDLQAKAGMLGDALRNGTELLQFYALNYLRRSASDRGTAVRILSEAVRATPASDRELETGRVMSGGEFFVQRAKADAVNGMVVAALASALVGETDASRRESWAQLLASCVLGSFTGDEAENGRIRSALAHAEGVPKADRVLSALALAEESGQADERPRVERLKRVWETP